MRRAAQITMIAGFLAAIDGVPVTQALLDWLDGDLPQCLELFDEAPTEQHLRQFEDDLEDNSWFEEQLRPRYMAARYRLTGDLGEKALQGDDGWFFYHPGVKYLYQPYFRELPDGVKPGDPVEAIAHFRDELGKRGIALLVVIVPGKATVYHDRLADADDVEANTRRVVGELARRGVEVLTLHEALRAARAEADALGQPLYLKTDTHWSGEGARIAAAAVASRLRREPWAGAPETPRYDRRPVVVAREGDVLRMTQIPVEFPEERVTAHQVFERDGGALYADDEQSPLLWLGDSFSRIYQTDAPKSAGIIANVAYALQRPLASIVNDGGASTLVRQQLARRLELLQGKRMVVWEFVERDIRFGMRGWQTIGL